MFKYVTIYDYQSMLYQIKGLLTFEVVFLDILFLISIMCDFLRFAYHFPESQRI